MSAALKATADRLLAAAQRAGQAATAFNERSAQLAAEALAIQAEAQQRAAMGVRVTAGPSALSTRRIAMLEAHANTQAQCTTAALEANRELSAVAMELLQQALTLQAQVEQLSAQIASPTEDNQ